MWQPAGATPGPTPGGGGGVRADHRVEHRGQLDAGGGALRPLQHRLHPQVRRAGRRRPGVPGGQGGVREDRQRRARFGRVQVRLDPRRPDAVDVVVRDAVPEVTAAGPERDVGVRVDHRRAARGVGARHRPDPPAAPVVVLLAARLGVPGAGRVAAVRLRGDSSPARADGRARPGQPDVLLPRLVDAGRCVQRVAGRGQAERRRRHPVLHRRRVGGVLPGRADADGLTVHVDRRSGGVGGGHQELGR